jgi:hypothetical protein
MSVGQSGSERTVRCAVQTNLCSLWQTNLKPSVHQPTTLIEPCHCSSPDVYISVTERQKICMETL